MRNFLNDEPATIAKKAFKATIITILLINIWSFFTSDGILYLYSGLTLASSLLCMFGGISSNRNTYLSGFLCTGTLAVIGMMGNLGIIDINTSGIDAALIWNLKSMLYPFVVWIIVYLSSLIVKFIIDKFFKNR